ncbi:MAG: hypothetical protein CL609_23775 [Anaerolineaceae bacterium]|nr:hypothetical protein [Anaerolineaceae bacterium]
MFDLKPYFDAARSADEEVNKIMNQMNDHFTEGTDEGKQAALDLRPALDEAKAKAEEANKLYLSMREAASVSSGAAKEFVPASENLPEAKKGEMKRGEFLALDAKAQMEFIKAGGKVREDEE